MGDAAFLSQALELALPQQGFCAPNPAVGAILVKDGKVIGQGTHLGSGNPHAEVEAVASAKGDVAGATLYVTLEPCCHFGKTPPCTKLILEKKIKEVVYGFEDPNPKVKGKGEKELSRHGVVCRKVAHPQIEAFYRPYAHWHETGLPYVTAKMAMSLNGKIAHAGGKRAFLSGEIAQRFTHNQRKASDAILTTVSTIINDDPLFNVRLTPVPTAKPVFVLDRKLRIPSSAAIFTTAKRLYLFHGNDVPESKVKACREKGAILVETDVEDWELVLEEIGRNGFYQLWVEVGGTAFQTLLASRLMQRTHLIVSPKWLERAGLDAACDEVAGAFSRAQHVEWTSLGEDALLTLTW